jgi:hypothetical protein
MLLEFIRYFAYNEMVNQIGSHKSVRYSNGLACSEAYGSAKFVDYITMLYDVALARWLWLAEFELIGNSPIILRLKTVSLWRALVPRENARGPAAAQR